MEESPRAEQLPPGLTLGELRGERDINVAQQQHIYYFAAAVGDIAEEAQARSRTSAFFAEMRSAERLGESFAQARVTELCTLLATQQLLILHPQPDVPAALMARQIGAVAKHPDPAQPLTVLEFTGQPADDRRFDLRAEIERFAEPCLFLVPEASREVLGWHLGELAAMLGQHRHQLLAVTAIAPVAWRLTLSEGGYWHDVSAAGLYDHAALTRLLREGVTAETARLPISLGEEWRTHTTFGGCAPEALAQRLGTPLKVQTFLQGLRRLQAGADAAVVDGLLSQIAHQQLDVALRRWFFQQLGRRDQLIALGASLFTGLREDLFFAQAQRLLAEAWGLREFEGRLLDYVDLEPAEAFFAFNEVEPGRVQVESRYGDLRPNLLLLAAPDYQRHIRQAVTWMANLLRQSMQRGVSRQEGFEQYAQRAEVLLQVYLDERAAQPAGDRTLEHGGRKIPIRLEGQRPLTTTEHMAKQWLLSEGGAAQHRLALLMGLAQVRALDRREQAYIAEQRLLAAQSTAESDDLALPEMADHGPIIAGRDVNIAGQQTIIYTAVEHQRRLDDYLALLRRLGEGEQAAALLAGDPPLTDGLPLEKLRLVLARAALRWEPPLPDPAIPIDELTRRSLVAELLLPLVTSPQMLLAPAASKALVALSSKELVALVRREGRAHLGRIIALSPDELLKAHQALTLSLADPQYAEGCRRLLADLAESEAGRIALAVALRERERAPEVQGAPVPPVIHLLAASAVGGAAGAGLLPGGAQCAPARP